SGHGFPQWSADMFGGLPYVAAMHGDIFYPTFLLRMIMRTDLAMTWGFIIHLFLAGAFTLGFLRVWGLTVWPASFGALAYMMSGTIASYASPGHDGKLFVSSLLPLALWMLVRAIRDRRMWAWGVFALVTGLAVLSPHPQLLQYFLLSAGAFTLFVVLQSSKRNTTPLNNENDGPSLKPTRDSRFVITRLGLALGAVIVGLCIGAIQYWPVLGYVSVSPRASGRGFEFASQFSFPPEELFNTYLPQFTGMLGNYWGRNSIHLHSEYMGIVVLILAPLAFGAGSRKAFARFWLGTAIVAMLWALGSYTPFFDLIYLLPGTKFFRAPSTIIYLVTFSLSVLSALGFERVMNRAVSNKFLMNYLGAWCAFGILVAILGATGTLADLSVALTQPDLIKRGYSPRDDPNFLIKNGPAIKSGAFRSLVVLLIASASLVLYSRRKLHVTLFAVALLLTCGIDLWSIERQYWIFSRPASELFAGDVIINYLKAQKEPGRVFVYTKTADYRALVDPYYGIDGFGKSAGFMVHGIRSVTGYQGNVLARYEDVSDGKFVITPPFWRHENVRFLFTNFEVADTVLKKIIGPIDNVVGSRAYLYALPGDNPYSWVSTSTAQLNDTIAGRLFLTGTTNPKSFAAFAPSSGDPGRVPDPMPVPSNIETRTVNFSDGHAAIELSAPAIAGNALVVSENYYPGWTALVDGKPVKVVRAEYNLLGIPLTAGARSIVISFNDPRYDTGKYVTLFALALTALLIYLGARARPASLQF
ncbi:MAG: YfhO family protein, partial [Gemmatimonadaceae bacterium]